MSLPMDRLKTALDGRYSIERQLGEGGMASVYLAKDVRHERRVALKVLKPELAAVVGADRFLAEIRTTANLQHPHILPLFDSGQADGMLFYVMPYVDGESLKERLDRERQLPVEEAVRIATNIAEGLDYAHAHGVIHRDIKPANILLQAGKPVVSDFGIALAVSAGGGGRLTETGLSLGTPHYMSPEQATGDSRVGRATDIWALGCVLYEMLVGEPPYTGSTPQAILGRIIAGEGVSAIKQRASVPPHVDAVIRTALEKVPADRFSSAGELANALGDPAFRHGPDVRASGARPRSWLVPASAAAGVLLGVVATWLSVAPPNDQSPPGIVRFALPITGSDSLFSSSVDQDIVISPDGRLVVYLGRTPDGSTSQLYVQPTDQFEPAPLQGTEGGSNPFFSPDGQWIGFVDTSDSRTLKRVPVTGGSPTVIGTLPTTVNYIAGVSWPSDDRLIVGTGGTGGLWSMSLPAGEVEQLTQAQHHWPWVIRGGDAVLMTDHARGLELAALDLRTGETRLLGLRGTSPRYLPTGHLLYADSAGSVVAASFDPVSLEVIGDPVLVLGNVETKSVTEGAANFSVSDDGHLVYVQAASSRPVTNLLSVAQDGGRTVLTSIDGIAWFPRVSPEGSKVAVAIASSYGGAEADVWAIDIDRRAPTRLTFGGNNRFYPIWTPDGRQVTHADGNGVENRIIATMADGSGVQDTLIADGGRRFVTSWSPDGETIAYHFGPGAPNRDIGIAHVDDGWGASESLVTTSFEDVGPIFSPDGRWIAYVSNRTEQNEIYARPFPGPGAEVTISVGGGSEPVWSRTGRELFYRDEGDLMVVAVELAGTSLNPSAPRRLFADPYMREMGSGGGVANYDVTPSGRFVMIEQVAADASIPGAEPRRIHVVLNWFEELRARVPN